MCADGYDWDIWVLNCYLFRGEINVSLRTGAVEQAEDIHLWKGLEPEVIYLPECSYLKETPVAPPGNCGVVGSRPKVQRKKRPRANFTLV